MHQVPAFKVLLVTVLALSCAQALAQARPLYEFRVVKKGLAASIASPEGPAAPTRLAQPSTGELSFGAILVGRSATLQVLLSNVGEASLELGVPRSEGASFEVTTNCGAVLASGEHCLLDVAFSPPSSGAFSGRLTVGSNATNAPHAVSLLGSGVQASASLQAPGGTNFGAVSVGDEALRTFELLNTGDVALAGAYVALNREGWTLQATTCGTPQSTKALGVGDSCSATVRYAPTSAGESSAVLAAYSSTLAGPVTLPLTATGATASGSLVAVSNTDFGVVTVGTSVRRSFTFTNTGAGTASGARAVLSGSGLSLAANTCGTPQSPVGVPAGQSCSVEVDYTPTTTETLSGTVSVLSSAQNSPSSLSLTGSAVGPVTFGYTGTLGTYVTPKAGVYSIYVEGARGGTGAFLGGNSGQVTCNVSLQAGVQLKILVGYGGSGTSGGGGGSFVATSMNAPIAVAGGGGGGTHAASGGNATGFSGSGSGGAAGSGTYGSGGGGGFTSNGASATNFYGGTSFINGGAASSARAGYVFGAGGFGGGGSGSTAADGVTMTGGGGGGYNGGAGAAQGAPGAGGSSFCAGTGSFQHYGYSHRGKVIITPP